MLYFSWHFWLLGSSFPWGKVRWLPAPLARLRSPLRSLPYGVVPRLGGAVGTLPVARLPRPAVHRGWPRRWETSGVGLGNMPRVHMQMATCWKEKDEGRQV